MSAPFAGTSPAGLLMPLNYVIEGEPPIFLADAIDPATGEFISIEQGFDPTDAWLLTQLCIDRGSGSAVLEQGRNFRDVTHISEPSRRILDQELRRTAKPLVDAREVTINSVLIEEDDDSYAAKFSYRQTQTGTERNGVSIPLGSLSGKAVA